MCSATEWREEAVKGFVVGLGIGLALMFAVWPEVAWLVVEFCKGR